MRNLRNSKGFTLIELMIVVVIIGILAAIAIPKFTAVSKGAKESEAGPILKQICQLAESENLKTGSNPANIGAIPGWNDPQATYYTFTYDGSTNKATATAKTSGVVANKVMDCATKVIT